MYHIKLIFKTADFTVKVNSIENYAFKIVDNLKYRRNYKTILQ